MLTPLPGWTRARKRAPETTLGSDPTRPNGQSAMVRTGRFSGFWSRPRPGLPFERLDGEVELRQHLVEALDVVAVPGLQDLPDLAVPGFSVCAQLRQALASGPQQLGEASGRVGDALDQALAPQGCDLPVHGGDVEPEQLGKLLERERAELEPAEQLVRRAVEDQVGVVVRRAELVPGQQGQFLLEELDDSDGRGRHVALLSFP